MEDCKVLAEKIEDWQLPIKIWEVFSHVISYIVVVVHCRAKPGLILE